MSACATVSHPNAVAPSPASPAARMAADLVKHSRISPCFTVISPFVNDQPMTGPPSYRVASFYKKKFSAGTNNEHSEYQRQRLSGARTPLPASSAIHVAH
jgi:hypothetical protein